MAVAICITVSSLYLHYKEILRANGPLFCVSYNIFWCNIEPLVKNYQSPFLQPIASPTAARTMHARQLSTLWFGQLFTIQLFMVNKRLFIQMGKNKKDKKKQIELKQQQKRQQRRKQRQMFKKMKKKMTKGDTFKLTKQYVQYYESFAKQLQFLRLKLKDVSGDGNCLFRSMADQLDGNQNTHMFLRDQACKYILNNQQFFRNFLDEEEDGTIQKYVQGMRKNGEWGGHLELQALSECLRCIIVIHKKNLQQYYVTPIISQPTGTIFHLAYFQHQDFEHYLSIRDIDDNSQDPAVNKLKGLNNNMYRHLIQLGDPQQLALMKQIEQLQLNDYQNNKKNENYEDYQYEQEQEYKQPLRQPYPGLPPNKKCKCGSQQTYKSCCLKDFYKKQAASKSYY